MACGKTLCQECATEWDGINYCAPCVGRRRATASARGSAGGWILVGLAAVVLAWLAPRAVVWGSVLLARMVG